MKFLTRDEIDAIPDLEPMIDGVLDKGTVTMLAAQPGAGKSFLALDWACRYATGTPWQGRAVDRMMKYSTGNYGPGKVLYIAAEGARGLKTRLKVWENAWKTRVQQHQLRMLDHPVNLGSHNEVAILTAAMEDNGPFGLVIIDTLARCSFGLEENNANEMGRVIQAAYAIRNTMGPDGTVLLIHHLGKGGVVRGSSALMGGVDLLLRLDNHDGHLVLEDEKRKDGRPLNPMSLKLVESGESMTVQADTFTPSVTNPLVAEMTAIAEVLPLTKNELKSATRLSEKDLYHYLSQGLKHNLIQKSTNEKNPRYSLAGVNGNSTFSPSQGAWRPR